MTRKLSALILALLLTLTAGAQKKDLPYPVLKQLKPADMEKEIFPTANKRGLWGFADEKGRFVIKPVFDNVTHFSNSAKTAGMTLSRVSVGGKVGYLGRDAQYVILPIYDEISDFSDGIYYFSLDDKEGLLDRNGEVLFDGADELLPFVGKSYTWYSVAGRWGAVDKTGKVLLNPQFSKSPSAFNAYLYQTEVDGKKGLINKDNLSTVFLPEYDSIETDNLYYFVYAVKDGQYEVYKQKAEKLDYILTFDTKPMFDDGCYKYLDGEMPMLLLKDGSLKTAVEYEQYLWGLGSYKYRDNQVLPGCFKHPARCVDDNSDQFWNQDHPFVPNVSYTEAISYPAWRQRIDPEDPELSAERLGEVYLDKGKNVLNTGGNLDSTGSSVTSVYVELEDYDERFPLGPALSTLFQTINSSKVAAFDKENNTDLYKSWDGIQFVLYGGLICGDNRFFAINMNIVQDYSAFFVQRFYVVLDYSGKIKAKWSEDGDVYDSDSGVSKYEFNLFCPDENAIFIVEPPQWEEGEGSEAPLFDTKMYSPDGKLISSYRESFLPYAIVTWNGKYLVLGAGIPGWGFADRTDLSSDEKVLFSKDGTVQMKGWFWTIDGWDNLQCLFPIGDSIIGVKDKKGSFLGVLLLPDCQNVPAIKYREDTWCGQTLRSFALNAFSPSEWTVYTESNTRLSNSRIDKFDILSATPDEIGYYIYSYDGKYGYFGNGRISLPVFDKVSPFSGGTAEVVIGGASKTITPAQLLYYTGK